MIKYNLKKNNNRKSDYYGQYYAYPVIDETIDLDKLAAHMASHNTPFSKGVIRGLLTDMVSCIKELMLEGKNVKINDLAIFSIGIKNAKGGADSEEDFSVTSNIQTVKFRARATGELTSKSLDLAATLKRVGKATVSPETPEGGSENPEP
jgi:predicted histone-like DNA-binding protein